MQSNKVSLLSEKTAHTEIQREVPQNRTILSGVQAPGKHSWNNSNQVLDTGVDKETQDKMLKLNSILQNSHVMVEQLNGHIQQIARIKEQLIRNLNRQNLNQ